MKSSNPFLKEEMYSLTDQIRRSSRSTNINLTEAYRKRRYRAHFISKLTDSDMENSETKGWLMFALSCKYLKEPEYQTLVAFCDEGGKLINHMINNPDRYGA